jgi:hypothetical protein
MQGRNLSTGQGPKQGLDSNQLVRLVFLPCFGMESEKAQEVKNYPCTQGGVHICPPISVPRFQRRGGSQ